MTGVRALSWRGTTDSPLMATGEGDFSAGPQVSLRSGLHSLAAAFSQNRRSAFFLLDRLLLIQERSGIAMATAAPCLPRRVCVLTMAAACRGAKDVSSEAEIAECETR